MKKNRTPDPLKKAFMSEVSNAVEEFEWEDLMISLGYSLKEIFKDAKELYIRGENMGWGGRQGYKTLLVDPHADEFSYGAWVMNSVSLNTDWTATIYKLSRKKGIYINLRHHDNPVSGDRYYITKL